MKKPHLPLKWKGNLSVTHTTLHAFYWGNAALHDLSMMTPIYAGLFVLTIIMHFYSEEV